MKRIALLLLALCLILTACGTKESEDTAANVVLDFKEYEDLDGMNAAAETNIKALGKDETDEKFSVISGSIAQYSFKLGNEEWCVRASKNVENDISGLYYDNIGFEKDTNSTYYNDDVYLFRFFNEDVQYTISLNVKDMGIAASYFDEQCSLLKTNITGVQSGYTNELIEDGDDVIFRSTIHNDDGSTMVTEIIYVFEADKMMSILNRYICDTEEAAKELYDTMLESGYSEGKITFEGSTISMESNGSLDFYSSYSKKEFIEMMQSSMSQ